MLCTRFAAIASLTLAAGPMLALAPAQPEGKAITPVAADEQKTAEVMQLLGTLEGTWRMEQDDGSLSEAHTTFTTSSAGSVVREIMAVGEPHEMTNLYHMDGDRVVCTHYCAVGNQPRMVAEGIEETDEGRAIGFAVDSVSNFTEGQDHYMGGLQLVFVDDDTVHQVWTTFDTEGEVAHRMTFVMKRDAEL